MTQRFPYVNLFMAGRYTLIFYFWSWAHTSYSFTVSFFLFPTHPLYYHMPMYISDIFYTSIFFQPSSVRQLILTLMLPLYWHYALQRNSDREGFFCSYVPPVNALTVV